MWRRAFVAVDPVFYFYNRVLPTAKLCGRPMAAQIHDRAPPTVLVDSPVACDLRSTCVSACSAPCVIMRGGMRAAA